MVAPALLVQVLLAVAWADAVVVPVNIRWSVKEIAYSLVDSGVGVLCIDDAFLPMLPALRESALVLPCSTRRIAHRRRHLGVPLGGRHLREGLALEHPDGTVLRRDLGAEPVPFIDMTAVGARFVPAEDRSPEQRAAVELAETLTDELLSSDAYLFAVPLYNWNHPASVQAWVDRILTAAPLRAGEGEPIAGRPAVVVHSRGGGYGPGTPREGWDHAEPYLRRILEDVWKLDVTMVTAELTLAATVPAMATSSPSAPRRCRPPTRPPRTTPAGSPSWSPPATLPSTSPPRAPPPDPAAPESTT